MNNPFENIVVYISKYEQLEEARALINNYGQNIIEKAFFISESEEFNYLQSVNGSWLLFSKSKHSEEITLGELADMFASTFLEEDVLKKMFDVSGDFTPLQSPVDIKLHFDPNNVFVMCDKQYCHGCKTNNMVRRLKLLNKSK